MSEETEVYIKNGIIIFCALFGILTIKIIIDK